MLKSIKFLAILVISFFSVQVGFAQSDSYIFLDDPSGLQPSDNDKVELEKTADILINSLPEEFRDDFKVLEGGIYPIMEYLASGSGSSMAKLKDQANTKSDYYLLIVRNYNKTGKIKYSVSVKLPNTAEFECVDDTVMLNVARTLNGMAVSKSGQSVFEVENYLIQGSQKLIQKIITCECQGFRDDCSSSFEVLDGKLLGLKFKKYQITNIEQDDSWVDGTNGIYDYANKKFTIGGLANVSIPQQIKDNKIIFDNEFKIVADSNFIVLNDTSLIDTTDFEFMNVEYSPTLQDQQYLAGSLVLPTISVPAPLSSLVYILNNNSFGNNEWSQIVDISNTHSYSFIEIWAILEDGNGNSFLYSRFFLEGINDSIADEPPPTDPVTFEGSLETRTPTVTPMQVVLKVLGNAAIDAFFQATFIYLTDSEVLSLGAAFSKVSYGGALVEGLSSMIPWKDISGWKAKLGAIALKSVVSALAVVIEKATSNPNYTASEGVKDFLIGFGSSVLTEYVGSILSKGGPALMAGATKWAIKSKGILRDLGCVVMRVVSKKFGCFPAGTLVMTGSDNFTSIENINLFDPIVSKINVAIVQDQYLSEVKLNIVKNERYENDKYVTEDQLYRDGFELNNNWFEVVLEQIEGSTICKLALCDYSLKEYGIKKVGDTTKIVIPEMGAIGDFRVMSLKHALPRKTPTNEDIQYNYGFSYVTGIFEHTVDECLEIILENNDTLLVTFNHPIYSVTEINWIPAVDLNVGDEISSYNGIIKISKITKKHLLSKVYTLEVKDYHNFLVGKSGILVHNSCWEAVNYFLAMKSKDEQKLFIQSLWKWAYPEFFARGTFFEKALRKNYFSGWDFTGIPGLGISNYKAIDFYGVFDGLSKVASMKTTSVFNPENWVNFPKNKEHLRYLQSLIGNQVSNKNANSITNRADEVLIYIFTKAEPDAAKLTMWKSEIAKVAPGVKVVVQSIEKAMKL